ncbi:threonylcarbamoyl-AMP synthase [Candidatus Poribacteria bacterium]|nr:threonylcarbamoyl-AMP synthase [Candidatus Poribacteria bacterium]
MTELLEPTPAGISRAASLLRAGRLVAFPTETVYGLGANALEDDAVRRIFTAKGRPSHNPTIIHVPDAEAARRFAAVWPSEAERLAERFWPGPLTLVVPAAAGLSPAALAGGTTVGLRAPDHPVALELLRECGLPLAAPSANSSGHLSPVEAAHVIEDLGGRIDAVLDGGTCLIGIESTVLDLTAETPTILRPGMVSRAQLETALGRSIRAASVSPPEMDEPAKSPGLLERHYAPHVPLRVRPRAEVESAPSGVARIRISGKPVPGHLEWTLPASPEGFAAGLYRTLWACQTSGAREIWLEEPPEGEAWLAVRDRLRRAAALISPPPP